MCQGLVLLFDSTSYKQTHCTKLPGNQAASLLLNGTAVFFFRTFFHLISTQVYLMEISPGENYEKSHT